MLFDLKFAGHHANYIRHLVRYWGDNRIPGRLDIVVSPHFIQRHQDVVVLVEQYPQSTINFIPISTQESLNIEADKTAFERAVRNLREWRLLCKYAASLNADQCMIMYLDTCELPLTLGLKPPCPISGIYFRPTFHYSTFSSYRFSIKEKLQQFRERLFLHRTLQNPKLHTLFCLDPLVDQTIKQIYPEARAIPLADPVEIPDLSSLQPQTLQEKHKIHPDRTVFLLFGFIDERKGIYQLLEALRSLPSEVCQQLCILVVGQANPSEKAAICTQIDLLCQTQPVQIIPHFKFVSEEEVRTYFQLTDMVLALYQRHVGMSGILLLAAAAGKPVISTNYGLMGELVKRYQLGLTVDSTKTEAIAQGLLQCLNSKEMLYNPEKMKQFAEENDSKRFAETVFQNL
ncbi:MAG: glycosyltransferase family 4 protein [Drouetiella hepatica Uher 2000/2452]|uniref:Glycosyltransferase family 4 protein n=1 Tax=Drouetiella hepatica Uher 2000/2452 TaxID=904376 RepID=A0A951QCB2_9CYAN|nr:glycosyltransferase family 4 protein [Drouetiella hepatica Uher 2000/2452]